MKALHSLALVVHVTCYAIASNTADITRTKYLLYTVNSGEGFNLCRDVYIRAANLVISLRQTESWVLVLPPWPRLYHWSSPIEQRWLSWDHFFDVSRLQAYVPSISYDKFLELSANRIDELIHTRSFDDPFEGGQWTEKTREVGCDLENNLEFWGHTNVTFGKVRCVASQGRTDVMKPYLLNKAHIRSVLITMFQSLLHNDYGTGALYWAARRSMVYAQRLRDAGNRFMKQALGYNRGEGVGRESPRGGGGPFISVHLRRRDYLGAHSDAVPSLSGAANQIKQLKLMLNVGHVFLATDAPISEKQHLQQSVPGLVWYEPSWDDLVHFKDGGVAIIDQWIAAHAQYFAGTADSTFSFRIREDRQLMGFSKESTFNCLCGPRDNESDINSCEKPSYWPIVGFPTKEEL